MSGHSVAGLSWLGIARLGLVQTALGAIIVLTTATLNRVMVVELGLPALLPGLLVGLYYAIQVVRPRLGYGSDLGQRRTPWIVAGMAVLALGAFLAASATVLLADSPWLGLPLAVVGFVMIGLGSGAAGTSLLVLLASQVQPRRRGAAASLTWVMMIMGFILTAGIGGAALDPFSLPRLLGVTAAVSVLAFLLACGALWRVEWSSEQTEAFKRLHEDREAAAPAGEPVPFRQALAEVWREPFARRFTLFVFVAMLAYSTQDLILEPYAGAVFALTPGESTQLSGMQHSGVLLGMLLVALCTNFLRSTWLGSLRSWTMAGCLGSALASLALAAGGASPETYPLRLSVFALGVANGAFAVAAIGSMMDLVGRGRRRREGLRMGMWGAAQALAFGAGGLLATGAVDALRLVTADVFSAYAWVFVAQGAIFVWAAALAMRVYTDQQQEAGHHYPVKNIALQLEQA